MEHLLNEERLSNSGLFNLGERQIRDLINVHKYLKRGGRHVNEARLDLVVHNSRTRSNGLELEHRKFCTSIWKKLLTVRVREH